MTQSFYTLLIGIALLLSLSKAIASGSGKIEGSVIDVTNHKPIASANIELLRSTDSLLMKSTATSIDGKYLFENVAYGNYLLRISCVGYRKKFVPLFNLSPTKPSIKFETTNLSPESKTLQEVVVTGRKLTGFLEDNKTIYTINAKAAEFAQAGIELLRLLPDVTVDYLTEDVKLAGRSNILFLVNGRRVDRSYLTQLNPLLVDKIEVTTNPGAKYDSDADAIINIILKKNMLYGISGRLRIQAPTSPTILSKNNGSIDLFLKKFRFYIASNCNLQRYRNTTSNDRIIITPFYGYLLQNSGGTSRGKRIGFSYGLDWFANESNSLNFYSTIRPKTPEKTELTSDNRYTSVQSNFHNKGSNNSIDKNYFYDYSVYYQHKFQKKDHEISFESYFSNKSNTGINNYYEQDYLQDGTLSDQLLNKLDQTTENSSKQLILKADYTHPFSKETKLSAGYNGTFIKSNYFYNNVTINYTDLINQNESRQIAYSNLSWNLHKLNFQTGIRYELSTNHISHSYDTVNHYLSLLPSVSAQYKLGKKNTFRLNYRRSIIRPAISQLSPISYRDDAYQRSIGNPNLKPTYLNRLEFTHHMQLGGPVSLNYKPYVSLVKNDIRLINLISSDTILLRKYDNAGDNFEYGATFSGNFTLFKTWTVSSSWTYYQRKLKALPRYGISEDMKRTSWRLNVSTQYVLPKEWMVFIEYNYNAPFINYQSITRSYYDFVAGFSKTINKKFSVGVFTLNPWNDRYVYDNSITTTSAMVKDSKSAIKYNYLVFVRFGYKFIIAKPGKKIERTIETEEEKGVNKGIFN